MSAAPRTTELAAVLLAAGESQRLGRPKQLVTWQGKTLLRRAAEAAIGSGAHPVLAVVGFEAERMRTELAGLPLAIVDNPAFASGLGSSFYAAVAALAMQAPAAAGALFLLCDQPLVTATLLGTLLTVAQGEAVRPAAADAGAEASPPATGTGGADGPASAPQPGPALPLVACRYAGVLGPPAFFPRRCFAELATLVGDGGARTVLQQHLAEVVTLDFPGGELDIDTPEDYARATERASSSTSR